MVFVLNVMILGTLSAQIITGNLSNLDGDPLIGANIVWQGTSLGTISDESGAFSLSDEGIENRVLEISYVGFSTEVLTVGDIIHWEVMMIEDNSLQQVEISSKSKATRYQDSPAKIEVIGTREIERAACCSLAGCFSTNASVSAATTNVLTDAKELQILGLSGVYNQLLFDGMPLIQGLNFLYGSGSYPGTMIENIFVSKGSNSVLQGGQSISGQINIIPRNPETAERLYLNVFGNSFGESQINANLTYGKKNWKSLLTGHLTLPAGIRDKDGDGFRDIAATNRMSFYNKYVYSNPEKDKFKAQIGVRFWKEDRTGGTLDYDKSKDLGSLDVYGQFVDLLQLDAYVKMNYSVTEDVSITFQNSGFFNKQHNFFGAKEYIAEQQNYTSNLFADYFYGGQDNNLKVGLSFVSNQLEEEIVIPTALSFLDYGGTYVQDYIMPGAFVEHTLNHDKFTLIAGVRADKYPVIGMKLIPRILLRYQVKENSDLRISAGKGIRNAHLFSERINLLSSNRNVVIEETLAPEEAINLGVNYVHNIIRDDYSLTFSADGYYTFFQNQIFPEFEREIGYAYLSNNREKSISKSFQLEAKLELMEQFDFKWSYNYLELFQEVEGERVDLPFVATHKFLWHNSFETKNDLWQFDLGYKWTGPKKLPSTALYPEEYRISDQSESFSQLDFQITKRWEKFQIYGGIENIFDFRQTFPILAFDDPTGPYFDPSFNWGPTKGRELYLGVRYKI